nr:surface layer protein SapB11 [uncultured Campylobacter sp.]
MAVTQAQVAQLYVALFNRAPEGAGFNAWVAAGATKTVAQMANEMLASPATPPYFASMGVDVSTDRGYVELIYKNILGKDYTQDPDGINAWVRHLQLGNSRGDTLVKLFEVATSAEARAADPVAAQTFANKTEVSAYMAQKIASIDSDGNGGYDYTPFQEIIRSTNSTNLAAQKARIDAMATVTTHTLTTEDQTITGGEGLDVFSAVSSSYADRNTLKVNDKLDGGRGTDALNVAVNDSFTGFVDGYAKNIEILNLTNTSDSQRIFNAAKIDGLKSVSTTGTNGIRITDLASIVNLTVNGQKDATKIGIIYNTNLTSGSNDVQNLTLNNVGRETAVAEATATDRHVKSMKVEFNGIETLNITTKDAKSYIKEVQNKAITVKGAADLDIATKDRDMTPASTDFVKSLDASTMTGNLTADLSDSRKYSSVKSGSGNDTIVVGELTVNSSSIDAGAGTDTLQVRSLQGLKKMTLKGVENIELLDKNPSGVTRLDLVGQNDIETLKVGQLDNELVVTSSSIKTVNLTKKVSPYATDAEGSGAGKVHVNDTSVETVNYKIDNATSPTAMAGKIRLSESRNVTVNLDASVITTAGSTNSDSILELPKANTLNLNVNTTVDSGISLDNSALLKTVNIVSANPNKFTLTADTNSTNIAKLNLKTSGSFDLGNNDTLKFVSDINVKGGAPLAVGSLIDLKNLGSISSENGVSVKVNDLTTSTLGGATVKNLNIGNITTKEASNAGANINLKNITNGVKVGVIKVGGEVNLVANNVGWLEIGGNITSKKSGITFDVSSVRHDVKIGVGSTLTAQNDINITAKDVEGKLDIGKLIAKNIVINATNIKNDHDRSTGSTTLKIDDIDHSTPADRVVDSLKITLKDVINSGGTGAQIGRIQLKAGSTVDIDAGNTRGLVKISTANEVTADKVSIDLSGTIGANSLKGIQADTIVYKGSTQTPLDLAVGGGKINLIAKQDLNSKDFTATVNASGLNDTLKVTVATKVTGVGKDLKTVTVSGDMGLGTQDKYEFNGANAAELTKIDFSGLRNVESGTIKTDAANKKIVSIKGTAGNDTIDASVTPFDAANVTIETGEGTNEVKTGAITVAKQVITIKGGSGNDIFDVSASKIHSTPGSFDGSSDNLRYTVIENINAGDKIKIANGTGSTQTGLQKVTLNPNGNAYANFAAFAKETGLFNSATTDKKVYAFSYQNDTYLFYNKGGAGATEFQTDENIVKLPGVNWANLDATVDTDGNITINGF